MVSPSLLLSILEMSLLPFRDIERYPKIRPAVDKRGRRVACVPVHGRGVEQYPSLAAGGMTRNRAGLDWNLQEIRGEA